MGLDKYSENSGDYDVVWLMEQVKTISAGINRPSNLFVQLHKALLTFFNMRQYHYETNDAYLRRFKEKFHQQWKYQEGNL